MTSPIRSNDVHFHSRQRLFSHRTTHTFALGDVAVVVTRAGDIGDPVAVLDQLPAPMASQVGAVIIPRQWGAANISQRVELWAFRHAAVPVVVVAHDAGLRALPGLDEAARRGLRIIVVIPAPSAHVASSIGTLLRPVLAGHADVVAVAPAGRLERVETLVRHAGELFGSRRWRAERPCAFRLDRIGRAPLVERLTSVPATSPFDVELVRLATSRGLRVTSISLGSRVDSR